MAFVERIVGGTDGTPIGNIGDRLKVDAVLEQGSIEIGKVDQGLPGTQGSWPVVEDNSATLIRAISELSTRLREVAAGLEMKDTAGRTRVNVETGTLSALTALGSTTATTFNSAKMNWDASDTAFATAMRLNITTL